MSKERPNLYLVGFMGAGKTTTSRLVAKRLGMRWADIDQEIEKKTGLSVREIFDYEGEAHFRGLERTYIEKEHDAHGQVIACGGGILTQEGMTDLLKSKGIVMVLHASIETIKERTNRRTTRPMINACRKVDGALEALIKSREPLFENAGPMISTDNRTPIEVAEEVIRLYESRSH